MSNLETLLEYLLERSENDEIFGKSFNDPAKKRPVSNPPEKNTPAENMFIDKLDKWFGSHLVAHSLNKFANDIDELIPIIKSGKYPELKPPSAKVYRGMSMTPEQLKSFLGIEDITIEAGTYKFINKSGILAPQKIRYYTAGKPISSWSIEPSVAAKFSSIDSEKASEKNKISVVFIANTNDPDNKFILNPNKLTNSYNKPISSFDYEEEVIAVGPVKFNSVIVYSRFDIFSDQLSADERKKAVSAVINNTVNEISAAITDDKSVISKAAQKLSLRLPSDGRVIRRLSKNNASMQSLANAIFKIIKRNAVAYGLKIINPQEKFEFILNNIYLLHDYRTGGDDKDLSNLNKIKRFAEWGLKDIFDVSPREYDLDTERLASLASRKRR